MKLDKWGEFNCERQRGHEDNKADHRAKVHRAFFNGQCYEWIGMREAKPVKRG